MLTETWDDKRDLYRTSCRWWLAGFRAHVQVDQCHLQRTNSSKGGTSGGDFCRALSSAHFIGLQSTIDRTEPEEDSPVYTTRTDKFRVYRFPWRQGSLFPSKHSGVAIAIRENTFLPANVRRICTPSAPLLKLVRGDAAFFDHELILAAVSIESARETPQREDLEVGA